MWQATIEDSTALQQALFFKPLPLEPLLHYSDFRQWSESEASALSYTVTLNPVMSSRKNSGHGTATWQHYEALKRTEASYRRMLISQPAVDRRYCDPEAEAGPLTLADAKVVGWTVHMPKTINGLDYWMRVKVSKEVQRVLVSNEGQRREYKDMW